ncbi:hypothetical protein PVK06_007976 [Gossypium arboreum]|uniref:RNase H type-1 domain-containing protein n=1 Tax=Gossypium arboreum TaxID=29729 RepID=A0ABR0QIZ1_GOSAR|nr:hypothetical protein PVK06_007976 [Gossypium arboreum]
MMCGYAIEDMSHVLLDCSFAKDAWMLVLLEQLKQRFFSSPFPNWFSLNLCFPERLQVVQTLSNLDLEDSGITVLQRPERIMRAEGVWKIIHIPRTQNLVADHLAKLSLNWKSSLQVFNEAPKEIIDLLQEDKDNGCLM